MKDYKCITHEVPNVVDGGYKINVFTSAGFKVFPQHLPYKPACALHADRSEYRIAQFRFKIL